MIYVKINIYIQVETLSMSANKKEGMLRKLKRLLWCSWKHRWATTMNYDTGKMDRISGRCYPGVMHGDDPEIWHCIVCHPCGEEVDKIINNMKNKENQ